MSDNRMADVAKILGVEFYEEFKVSGYVNCICRLTPYWFERKDTVGDWETDSSILMWLLNGKEKIVKQWKPEKGEVYYYIVNDGIKSFVRSDCFSPMSQSNRVHFVIGNCFKTKEEAEANLDRWADYLNQPPDTSWHIEK